MKRKMLVQLILSMILALASNSMADYGLGIYGNANLDNIIDEKDIVYINKIINGTFEPTELADANLDGKIDMEDIEQVEAIISGSEEELIFIDIFGEAVTINKPVERLVNMGWNGVDVTRALGAEDLLVAVGRDYRAKTPISYPIISKLPSVGDTADNCDYEKVLSLEPDAVQTNLEASWAVAEGGRAQYDKFKDNLPGIPLICLNVREIDNLSRNIRTYGYIIDKEDDAEEFASWIEKQNDLIKSRLESLSDEDRKDVYFEHRRYQTKGSGDRYSKSYIMAGGKNIADDLVGQESPNYYSVLDIDPEYVIMKDPEFIFIHAATQLNASDHGFETNDPSVMAAMRDELIARPELANVTAVEEGNVYVLDESILGGAGQTLIGSLYMAKLMHPELFEDIDPQAILQEYIDQFCYIDFNVKEQGVFIYPPIQSE
ncbi:ABC transporter substrate-binding protein [Methanothrix sp.]|jgi:iron complex transport system substrate-binding protein|uniref:ABC transporter substrate-binding protein n=1 Tax=Methanothrix sp. TaxID=90426 RepID=UPI00345E8A19